MQGCPVAARTHGPGRLRAGPPPFRALTAIGPGREGPYMYRTRRKNPLVSGLTMTSGRF